MSRQVRRARFVVYILAVVVGLILLNSQGGYLAGKSGFLGAGSAGASSGAKGISQPGGFTIFAFDDHAIPFTDNLYLTMTSAEKYSGNPVVSEGPAGSVDAARINFYGSVIHIGNKYRMWYMACDGVYPNNALAGWRVAYSESEDGIRWVKPDLGLTEHRGSMHNNLPAMPPGLDFDLIQPMVVSVLYDPDDAEPAHRYKMALYGRFYPTSDLAKEKSRGLVDTDSLLPVPEEVHATIYPFFSPDGLRWNLAVPAPKAGAFDEKEAPFTTRHVFEIAGLWKFDGIYYVGGQEVWPDVWMPGGDPAGRTGVTHWSGDFVHWSQEKSFSFQRYGYRSLQKSLEEAHEPVSVWNRGNVLLGLYGIWHGSAEASLRKIDLGFLISNDGVHFREPVADYVFLKAGKGNEWDRNGLLNAQGFENIGDETYIYYGAWDLDGLWPVRGSVGLATLRRDGFGYLSTRWPGDGGFTTMPISVERPGASVYVNAEGLGEDAYLQLELKDKLGREIPGFAGAEAASVKQSGLRVGVSWAGKTALPSSDQPIRLQVRFMGQHPENIKFYAAYVE